MHQLNNGWWLPRTSAGGDILVADSETVLVDVSQRTNEKGADKLAKFLFAAVAKILRGQVGKDGQIQPKEFGCSHYE